MNDIQNIWSPMDWPVENFNEKKKTYRNTTEKYRCNWFIEPDVHKVIIEPQNYIFVFHSVKKKKVFRGTVLLSSSKFHWMCHSGFI